jgi:tripartite-type tricarboxylate transporter receptor subunit TctC
MTRTGSGFCLAALAAAALALPLPVVAQPDEAFFKGKSINLYIGFAGGGSYDFYARMVSRFIGKHIPGNPTVVPQSMLGAGSLQLANFLFSSAPRDGTAMGIVTQTVAIEDALHSPGVRYKAAEFTAIGRATAILEVALAGPSSKVKTIADAKLQEMPVAGTGAGAPAAGDPKLLN